jgi:hypothetical protein
MSQDPETHNPATETALNPAVARCCQAYADTFKARQAIGDSDYKAKNAAAEAYRLAMPKLSSDESIHGFIACIAYGILIEAFENRQATQLLYAAQVASGALARTRKSQKRSQLRPGSAAT